MIRALIFDFDGLILDTETPVFRSWQELYSAQGGCLTYEQWAQVVGTVSTEAEHFARLEAQIGHPLDRETLGPQRRQQESELILKQPVLPGVREMLVEGKQRGLQIGLASSAGCPWVVGHLQRLDLLEYFDSVRGRDDVERVKPDPELFLTVLADLGASSRRKPWYSKIRPTASGQPKLPGCCAWRCQTRLRGNTPWRRQIYAWNRWLRCRCSP